MADQSVDAADVGWPTRRPVPFIDAKTGTGQFTVGRDRYIDG